MPNSSQTHSSFEMGTLIFNTCKMVCTGAKSKKVTKQAVNEVVRNLKNTARK
jgi:TATA-box binding protein (TBP) (component of TFIID and TFIIIB)